MFLLSSYPSHFAPDVIKAFDVSSGEQAYEGIGNERGHAVMCFLTLPSLISNYCYECIYARYTVRVERGQVNYVPGEV